MKWVRLLVVVALGCTSPRSGRRGDVVEPPDGGAATTDGMSDGDAAFSGDPGAGPGDSDAWDSVGGDDAPDAPACVPTSCKAEGIECGDLPDGCGVTLACGDCSADQTCGGAGPGKCGSGPCVPATCASLGLQCGQATDGCGEVLNCPSCPGGQTCTEDRTCACVPATCDLLGLKCGAAPDACGNELECGDCPGGQSCGGGGPGKCGDAPCVPTSCDGEGAECGSIADGCGDVVQCPACGEDEVCVANQCECAPKTCTDVGATCGTPSDGCGALLDCGPCPVCLPDCPNGFSCVAGDICSGGDLMSLELNVVSHPVHVTLKANGVVAKALPDCEDGTYNEWTMWSVRFIEKTRGYTITRQGNCDDLQPFDLQLFPGTYEVRAGGNSTGTNLPGFDQVVIDALKVTAPLPNLVLDVVSHPVHVTLKANGMPAKALPDCEDGTYNEWTMWSVRFIEKTRGYTITRQGNCDDLQPFDLQLFPGTYEVRAGGNITGTNLPGFDQVVIDALTVAAPQPNLVLNVVSHAVHVTLKANGALAKALPGCEDGTYNEWIMWSVRFIEKTRGYTITRQGNCDDLQPFGLQLFPGIYEVRAGGNTTGTNLPGFDQVVTEALAVP